MAIGTGSVVNFGLVVNSSGKWAILLTACGWHTLHLQRVEGLCTCVRDLCVGECCATIQALTPPLPHSTPVYSLFYTSECMHEHPPARYTALWYR